MIGSKGGSIIKNVVQNQITQDEEGGKEKLLSFYDPITNLGLIEETYRIIQPNVSVLEKKLENLYDIHEKFKEEML